MKEAWISLLNTLGLAWWVEIVTDKPRCTYYFGPFQDANSAHAAKAGYIEDLENENAQGIAVTVKRCKPVQLTIADDLEELPILGKTQVLSSQF